ncbi:hypothetical protein GGI25_006489 [Coemansia spiralis]|uniref:C2H2-type domain-containing protein n=2 Tax=Coemansia TaxID=4863 RepID=A0A9W8KUR6_9FUNG|nr:hypothetical protein BX070DRAFT_230099 [Coemansia spiralis]KAI9500467.1 hypothetical protein BX070DRAFT_230126 [Coemansia spiralis]KAJ1985705.1 hypothetical protein EDC05_006516 [Coemansia umbellata]KAJ2618505.1 hypothetical protein GGI26_006527 [Coemansia sp. RSA 1358]KAJ2668103.1 hypothetical protein GGI25_006489 [Coemansia spiralis]
MDVGALIITTRHTADAAETACDDASRPFECSWADCDRSFARKSDLVRHFRIHTGVKPFECPWAGCDKRFIQRSALKVHFRTHSGERPHTCEACERSFSDSSSLARHRRTHTGVRPYGCDHPGCSKRFTRKTSLRKHALTHSPEHPKSRRRAANAAIAATASGTEALSSATVSPALSPSSRHSTPSSSTAASPLLSVSYLTTPQHKQYHHPQAVPSYYSHYHHYGRCHASAGAVEPTSPGCSSSGASTVCNSPSMRSTESMSLPPISSLLHYQAH